MEAGPEKHSLFRAGIKTREGHAFFMVYLCCQDCLHKSGGWWSNCNICISRAFKFAVDSSSTLDMISAQMLGGGRWQAAFILSAPLCPTKKATRGREINARTVAGTSKKMEPLRLRLQEELPRCWLERQRDRRATIEAVRTSLQWMFYQTVRFSERARASVNLPSF